jgi:hypothetical protein
MKYEYTIGGKAVAAEDRDDGKVELSVGDATVLLDPAEASMLSEALSASAHEASRTCFRTQFTPTPKRGSP